MIDNTLLTNVDDDPSATQLKSDTSVSNYYK